MGSEFSKLQVKEEDRRTKWRPSQGGPHDVQGRPVQVPPPAVRQPPPQPRKSEPPTTSLPMDGPRPVAAQSRAPPTGSASPAETSTKKKRSTPGPPPLDIKPRGAAQQGAAAGWAPAAGGIPMSPHARLTEFVLGRPYEAVTEKYILGRELGRGQFGVTYLATHRETGKKYACKSIAKRKLTVLEEVKDIQREVAIMHTLVGHPGVVELQGAYEDRHACHLVMELCEGGELFDRIAARGHYSEKEASKLCGIIISVVKACHSHGVMHRDLKPENFLLGEVANEASLKATDFGLSTFFKPGQVFSDLVGSPYYVAPEVLRRRYGPEADMWSVGVILYIMLSGVPPFWGETEKQIFQEIRIGRLDLESDPWPRVSPAAKSLVRGLLERNVAGRMTAEQALAHPWVSKDGVASERPLEGTVLKRLRKFTGNHKIKKIALNYIASTLSEEEILGLRTLFESMDEDNNGTISLEELKKGLNARGCEMEDEELIKLVSSADVDEDGSINYSEFLAATIHLHHLEKAERIWAAFKHFDRDASGFITLEELTLALEDHHVPTSKDQMDRLMAEMDKDGDGRINYDEFAAMMRNDTGVQVFSPNLVAVRAASPSLGWSRFKDLPVLKSPMPRSGPLSGPLVAEPPLGPEGYEGKESGGL